MQPFTSFVPIDSSEFATHRVDQRSSGKRSGMVERPLQSNLRGHWPCGTEFDELQTLASVFMHLEHLVHLTVHRSDHYRHESCLAQVLAVLRGTKTYTMCLEVFLYRAIANGVPPPTIARMD